MTLSQGSGIYSECTKFLPFFIISAVWSKSRGEEGRWNHYLILLCRYEKIAERSLVAGPVTVNAMKISICTEQMQTLLFWASDAYFEGINPFVWTENETRVELSEEELETINQILNL